MNEQKSGNSIKIAPKVQLVTDERTNSALQPEVYEHEEKGTGDNFTQRYMPNSQTQMNFFQGQELLPQGQK